ncbi:MAG: NAD-dependent dehydratase [Sediminibacterium sp.]
MLHTILGAGGPVGKSLATALSNLNKPVRLVSRQPLVTGNGQSWFKADLSSEQDVIDAVEGTEVAYLTIGFPYSTKIWRENWPLVMKNVTTACLRHGVRLVFFDNIYAVSPNHLNPITESSPLQPCSKKGEIRAEVIRIMMEAVEKKGMMGLIARSADFLTLEENKGMIKPLLYDRMKKNQRAQWICNARVIHNFSYLPDLGKGTALLGTSPAVMQQVWNLPTDPTPMTGADWIRLMAEEMHASEKYTTISAGMIKLLGLFVPYMRELVEMLYQYDRDYFFDSSKFNSHFNFIPTSPGDAIREMLNEKQ